MPMGIWMSDKLKASVEAGTVKKSTVLESVVRYLTPFFAVGLMDKYNNTSLSTNVTCDAHNQLARSLSAQSTVLLQNRNSVLPLSVPRRAGEKLLVAMIGTACDLTPYASGGGSGSVRGPYVVSPWQGVRNALGLPERSPGRVVNCSSDNWEVGIDYFHLGDRTVSAPSANQCCAVCSQTPGCAFWSFQKAEQLCWLKVCFVCCFVVYLGSSFCILAWSARMRAWCIGHGARLSVCTAC